VRLDQLRIGDRVLAFDSRTGRTLFSAVTYFTTAFRNRTDRAVRVTAQGWQTPLELSTTHLMLVSLGPAEQPEFVRAMDVRANVHWAWLHARKDELIPSLVTSVVIAEASSWFNPKTSAGTLVVDRFAASCYTESHSGRDWLYVPYNAWVNVFPFPHGALPEEGYLWYTRVPANMAKALFGRAQTMLQSAVALWS